MSKIVNAPEITTYKSMMKFAKGSNDIYNTSLLERTEDADDSVLIEEIEDRLTFNEDKSPYNNF